MNNKINELDVYHFFRLASLGRGAGIPLAEAKETLSKQGMFAGTVDELRSALKNIRNLDLRVSQDNVDFVVVKFLLEISPIYGRYIPPVANEHEAHAGEINIQSEAKATAVHKAIRPRF